MCWALLEWQRTGTFVTLCVWVTQVNWHTVQHPYSRAPYRSRSQYTRIHTSLTSIRFVMWTNARCVRIWMSINFYIFNAQKLMQYIILCVLTQHQTYSSLDLPFRFLLLMMAFGPKNYGNIREHNIEPSRSDPKILNIITLY